MDDATRQVRNVMVVALLDGKVTEAEKEMIRSLRDRLGMDREEFRQLVEEVKADPKRLTLSRDADVSATLGLLLDAARVDGEICDRELTLLRKVSAHLGAEAQLEALLPGGASTTAETPAELPSESSVASSPEETAAAEQAEILLEQAYAKFASWDAQTRQAKLQAVGDLGRGALSALLHALESYRTPDGLADALELKTRIVAQIGRQRDDRAIYYLAQQVNLGNIDDEITNTALRCACAAAMGQILGQTFPAGADGIPVARQWWQSEGRLHYDHLAF